MKNRIGEENINTQGTLMRIIDYNRNDDIIVEFQDEYKYQIRSQYKEFKNGKIKNPYDKIVFGVGFIGEGIYSPYIKEERKKVKLINIGRECYREDIQKNLKIVFHPIEK